MKPCYISIVIPIYNEAQNIPTLYARITRLLATLSALDYELIAINDASTDHSLELLRNIAYKDSKLSIISFSRNFGHQAALSAGYDHAQGDAIISIDADLQDPPELIKTMIERWQQGYQIVYARRCQRNDSLLKKWLAILYYKILNCVAEISIPRNVGDFRLIDRKVLQVIKQCKERSVYLRGMVAWAGFSASFIDFKRPNREYGLTGYTWSKMVRLGFDGLTSFSLFPLKIAAFFGFFMISTGGMMFIYVTYDALAYRTYYPLFKWLVIIIYAFIGVQMLLLWLIGEYIGRIYEQEKNRPLYIIEHTIHYPKTITPLFTPSINGSAHQFIDTISQ